MLRIVIEKQALTALFFMILACIHSIAHAGELYPNKKKNSIGLSTENSSLHKTHQRIDINLSFETIDSDNEEYEPVYLNPRFEYPFGEWPDEKAKKVSIDTVFKLALDEFDFLSGIKRIVNVTSGKIENYKKGFFLKGRVELQQDEKNKQKNTRRKLEIKNIKWNLDFDLDEGAVAGKLELGDHFRITCKSGKDHAVMTVIKFDF